MGCEDGHFKFFVVTAKPCLSKWTSGRNLKKRARTRVIMMSYEVPLRHHLYGIQGVHCKHKVKPRLAIRYVCQALKKKAWRMVRTLWPAEPFHVVPQREHLQLCPKATHTHTRQAANDFPLCGMVATQDLSLSWSKTETCRAVAHLISIINS